MKGAAKQRLDQALAARGLARSRSHARQLIEEGHAVINGLPATKPALLCGDEDVLEITGGHPYVGRGGVKLERALDAFAVDVTGLRAADIGASTGGFTHCLLARGASRVYAVDVGTGQLAQSVAEDLRVTELSRTDARHLTPFMVDGGVDLVVCDVSFISLHLILPCMPSLLLPGGRIICLIKPQFEAGRDQIGKKGLVKNPKAHIRVLEGLGQAVGQWGLEISRCIPSPVRGGEGNIEYLALLQGGGAGQPPDFLSIVRQAFAEAPRQHDLGHS